MQHHHPGLSDLMSKSEQGDYAGSDHMGSMDGARANFSASLLGLQGKHQLGEQKFTTRQSNMARDHHPGVWQIKKKDIFS
jgi:hypothetical protein